MTDFQSLSTYFGIWSCKKKDRTQHLTYICRSLDRVKIFWLLVYVWTDENGGFRIRWNHILIVLRTLCKGCYRISKVFVFSWTGKNLSNTLSVDAHFLEHREKISLYTNIRIRDWTVSSSSPVKIFIVRAAIVSFSYDIENVAFIF